MPGPKYALVGGFGKQVESRYRSNDSGRFGNYDRKTQSWLDVDSPGPAYYDPPPPIVPPKPIKNGLGGAPRYYDPKRVVCPGPGSYKLPAAIGGIQPDKKSAPVVAFSKGERSGTKHLAVKGRESPGPIYNQRAAVGDQVVSTMPSAGRAAFSRAKRQT